MAGMILILPLAALVLAGLALALLGLRGRFVGGEPRCRRCGFDLRGNPEAANCGECGADLKRPRRDAAPAGGFAGRGWRRGRRGAVAAGAAGRRRRRLRHALRGVAWVRYAPAWYLLRDAESAPPADTAALGELVRRQTAGDLSDASLPRLVQIVLDRQADRAIPWDQNLGRLVETIWADGKLSDAAKADYLQNGFGLRLEARPDIRQGDVLPMKFDYDFRFGGVGNVSGLRRAAFDLRLGDLRRSTSRRSG